MKTAFLILALTYGTISIAELGAALYVKGEVVNMRERPSTSAAVVAKLNRGHKLIEIQRKGDWIEVGAEGTGGKTGWIYSSLISSSPVAKTRADPVYPPFQKFMSQYYKRLNKGLFTGAEYKGDGIINVGVNAAWLSVSRGDKRWSMNILLEAWSKCESGVVSINMVSPLGKIVMSNTKR